MSHIVGWGGEEAPNTAASFCTHEPPWVLGQEKDGEAGCVLEVGGGELAGALSTGSEPVSLQQSKVKGRGDSPSG